MINYWIIYCLVEISSFSGKQAFVTQMRRQEWHTKLSATLTSGMAFTYNLFRFSTFTGARMWICTMQQTEGLFRIPVCQQLQGKLQ